jgi:hypothetical protein
MTDEQSRSMLSRLLTACVQDRAATGWRYTLTHDCPVPIPAHLMPRGAVVTRWGSILIAEEGACIMLTEGYATDGCTMAADFSHGATLSRCLHIAKTAPTAALKLCGPFVAHWAHDFTYQHAPEIAASWVCSIREVIRWADELFHWHMLVCGTPRGQRLRYYYTLRLVGYCFAALTRAWRRFCKTIINHKEETP